MIKVVLEARLVNKDGEVVRKQPLKRCEVNNGSISMSDYKAAKEAVVLKKRTAQQTVSIYANGEQLKPFPLASRVKIKL